MSLATVAATAGFLRGVTPARNELTIGWHGNEPLVAGIKFYEKAFPTLGDGLNYRIQHNMQNKMVHCLMAVGCAFLHKWNVDVGVSIDGPAWIHDLNRRSRSGRGTHDQAMRGVRGCPIFVYEPLA